MHWNSIFFSKANPFATACRMPSSTRSFPDILYWVGYEVDDCWRVCCYCILLSVQFLILFQKNMQNAFLTARANAAQQIELCCVCEKKFSAAHLYELVLLRVVVVVSVWVGVILMFVFIYFFTFLCADNTFWWNFLDKFSHIQAKYYPSAAGKRSSRRRIWLLQTSTHTYMYTHTN